MDDMRRAKEHAFFVSFARNGHCNRVYDSRNDTRKIHFYRRNKNHLFVGCIPKEQFELVAMFARLCPPQWNIIANEVIKEGKYGSLECKIRQFSLHNISTGIVVLDARNTEFIVKNDAEKIRIVRGPKLPYQELFASTSPASSFCWKIQRLPATKFLVLPRASANVNYISWKIALWHSIFGFSANICLFQTTNVDVKLFSIFYCCLRRHYSLFAVVFLVFPCIYCANYNNPQTVKLTTVWFCCRARETLGQQSDICDKQQTPRQRCNCESEAKTSEQQSKYTFRFTIFPLKPCESNRSILCVCKVLFVWV